MLNQPLAKIYIYFSTVAVALMTLAIALKTHMGDIFIYAAYSHNIWNGFMPYLDFPIEYPPGVLIPIALAQPIGDFMGSYVGGFIFLSSLVVSILLWDWYKLRGSKQLIVICTLILPISFFVFFQLEIFAAALLYGSLRFLSKRRFRWSAVLLALSIIMKAYPIVCLPVILMASPREIRKQYLITVGGIIAALLIPFVLISPGGVWHSVLYHTGRPIEIGSGPAALGFILHLVGQPVSQVYTHASQAITFPGDHIVATISSILLLAFLSVSYVIFSKKQRLRSPVIDCAVMLLIYILFFKVGSPQYVVPMCFVAMLGINELHKSHRLGLFVRLMLLNLVTGSLLFVYHLHGLLTGLKWYGGLFVVLRILLVAELLFWLVKRSDLVQYLKTRPKKLA